MKIQQCFVLIVVTCALLAAQAIAQPAPYQPISYQGYLEQQGQPFSGTADLEFLLFTAATDGFQLGPALVRSDWPVNDGLFHVELDFTSTLFDGGQRFLEVRVDGVVMNPRQPVSASPRALIASTTVAGAVGLHQINTDQVQRRVTGECDQPFSYVKSVLANGSVVCGRNEGTGAWSVIGGGEGNSATSIYGVIGGGWQNATRGLHGTVAGGERNTAYGVSSSVSGGALNCAGGNYSWAGGYRAKVRPGAGGPLDGGVGCGGVVISGDPVGDAGTFIWADLSNEDFVSERRNQFLVRANGGAEFHTGNHGFKSFSNQSGTTAAAVQAESLHPDGIAVHARNESTDATLVLSNRGSGRLIRAFRSGGVELMRLENNGNLWIAGTLTQGSDRANKQDLKPIDVQAVLDQLAKLEISSWRYLHSDPESRHIGPMAQDFHSAFGYGVSDDSISSIDAQGIAFAAIQALHSRFDEMRLAVDQQIHSLQQENVELRAEMTALKVQADDLRELADRNAELEARLAALESLLLTGRALADTAP